MKNGNKLAELYWGKGRQVVRYAMVFTVFILMTVSCSQPKKRTYEAFQVFCEMVSSDAKPLAFSHPMSGDEADRSWNDLLEIAESYDVELTREDDFPDTVLFPKGVAKGKTIAIISKGDRYEQYKEWRHDVRAYDGGDRIKQMALARRLGRLLGYSPQGINQLLSKNSDYRNLSMYGPVEQITHLYYKDTHEALEFYRSTLGLTEVDSSKFQISVDAYLKLHPLNEAHGEGQAKSTAIALLTNQLSAWYEHLEKNEIPIKYSFKPKDDGAHDGFVAIDPGGYLLEFEMFKQHPENELFIATLAKAPKIRTTVNDLDFFGSITWTYHKDLLKMQAFYEEVLGFRLVADQGWAKIYQTSRAGFIGLVDERRGMENYAETKAIELEWKVSDQSNFHEYAEKFWPDYKFRENTLFGPENYIYLVN